MSNDKLSPELMQALWEAGKAAARHLGLGEPEYMTICGRGEERAMQEEKTINWRAMTPAQRNEEIHEKVMGHARKTATHTSKTRAGDTFSYNVTSWQTGGPDTPRYSQSLDAAWLVVRKILDHGSDHIRFDAVDMMFEALLHQAKIWRMPPAEAADLICRGALELKGYTVLTEEVQE